MVRWLVEFFFSSKYLTSSLIFGLTFFTERDFGYLFSLNRKLNELKTGENTGRYFCSNVGGQAVFLRFRMRVGMNPACIEHLWYTSWYWRGFYKSAQFLVENE